MPTSNTPAKATTRLEEMDGLTAEIERARSAIAEGGGRVVEGVAALGRCLAGLRGLANKDWAKRLKSLRIAPRVASRYMRVAAGSVGRIGPAGSDLAGRLPADLQKLERLSQLDLADLARQAADHDLRGMSRERLIDLVNQALGRLPRKRADKNGSSRGLDGPAERLSRLFRGAVDLITAEVAQGGEDARGQLRDAAAPWLSELTDALGLAAHE